MALSGGQRQRGAVGRAIVREPAAFLFDEPLSNLDAKLRVTTRAELKRLHQRLRTTTIYVTHDQEEAMTLGDRIVVMKDGVIHQADAPLAVYNRPINRFVAGFIGMPPMIFFDGAIKTINGMMVFEEGVVQGGNGAGELTFPGNGFKVMIAGEMQAAAWGMSGRHLVMGIRPEHFHLSSAGGGVAMSEIGVELSVVEPLGSDMDVYMKTALHEHVVGRVEADSSLVASARVTMYVDVRKIQFFEPGETGMNLSAKSEPAHANA